MPINSSKVKASFFITLFVKVKSAESINHGKDYYFVQAEGGCRSFSLKQTEFVKLIQQTSQ